MRVGDRRRPGRRALVLATTGLLVGAALTGCGARDVLDTAVGLPPTGRTVPEDDGLTPAAATISLPVRSAGSTDPDPWAVRGRFRVPEPVPPAAPVPPRPPEGGGRLELPIVLPGLDSPVVEGARPLPPRDCPGLNDGTASVPMRVTPGAGSLTLVFWFRRTPGLASVLVGAVPTSVGGGAPLEVWQTLDRLPATCQEVSVTVGGLRSGTAYHVLLDERVASTVTKRTTRRTVGRSESVTVG